jgi:hypothetical protein
MDKSGNEKYVLKAPVDIHFMSGVEKNGSQFVFGSKLRHPESMLNPYIAQHDTTSILWEFTDETVSGLAHIVDVKFKNSTVYFLGDDTGEAFGAISVYAYALEIMPEKSKLNTKNAK